MSLIGNNREVLTLYKVNLTLQIGGRNSCYTQRNEDSFKDKAYTEG